VGNLVQIFVNGATAYIHYGGKFAKVVFNY